MADASRVLGGKFHCSIGNARFEIIGELTLMPAGVEREANSTASGRLYVTEKAVPQRARCSFANLPDGFPGDIFASSDKFNMTFVESSRGIRHLFPDASAVGNPEYNLATGEVSGIEIVTDKYERA